MRLLTYILLSSLLAACGELSYKRGGNAQDFEQVQKTCRAQGPAWQQCMEKQGWQGLGGSPSDPLFAEVTMTEPRRLAPVRAEPAKAPASSHDHTPASVAVPAHAPIEDGPETQYSINSWWKRGASPSQLQQDQLACEKTLGADYTPDYKTQTYKRAFVACMHDVGWMAIRNQH